MPRVKTRQSFQQPVTVSTSASAAIEARPAPTTPQAQKHLYFVNAPVDFLVIGLGSVISFVVMYLVYQGNSVPWAVELATAMLIVVNHPHFAATNYRLYHSKDNIRQYPFTALVVPWLILAVVIGSFYSPKYIAVNFWKVYMYWSPYHFSGQTLGITLIYARRAGFFVGKWERFALSNVIYSTFLYMTARGEAITAASDLILPPEYEIESYRLGLPQWVPTVILLWLIVWAAVLTVMVVRWCITNKRMLPPIVLLPVITQFVWFIPGSFCPSFYRFVPMFHSLQYLLIAWSLQLKEKMDLEKIPPSVGYVVKESMRWGLINLVLGSVLFWVIPKTMYLILKDAFDFSFNYLFVLGIIIAGVQVHHFFVDGVIWKLKRKTVASPLMVNLDDLIHPPPAPALKGASA